MLKQVQHDMPVLSRKEAAFTLAETLITLMIIGVVAVLTIPALMQNINDRALLKQRQTVAAKIAEGFANMRVAGDLETKYSSTAAFVEAMKKYFKISQVCTSNELANCFAPTVTSTQDDETVTNTVSEMKDVDKVIGLRLTDGTSMLIKYNPEANGIPEGNTQVGKVSMKDGDVSAATFEGLFEYKFDVNGSKAPNAQGKDMLGDLVIAKGNPFGLNFEIINNTVYSPGATVNGVTWSPVDNSANGGYSDDYWHGAKNFCEALGGHLPDKSQLEAIAAKIYPCTPSGNYDVYSCSPDTTNELWSVVRGDDAYALWSSADFEGESTLFLANCREFTSSNFASSGAYGCDTFDEGVLAFCVK